jgi:hypothetical protein
LSAWSPTPASNEVIVTSNIYDPAARLRSYEVLAEVGRAVAV